jgi:AMMECR1 domain-containing protein
MAVTLWLDGQILARAWEIRQPLQLVPGTLALASKALDSPDQGRVPTIEEWPRVKVGVAVLHRLAEAADDKAVKAGQAVLILEGFKIGLGLPKDLPGKYDSAELLSSACQLAGLRPNAWLIPEKLTIFSTDVDELIQE